MTSKTTTTNREKSRKEHVPKVAVLMVGIGGYGYYYLEKLWQAFPPEAIELAGVVDPAAERSAHFDKLGASAVPIYAAVEDFYRDGRTADLAVVSSPPHFHMLQSCAALAGGSHVLCDKPLGATIQEGLRLIEAAAAARSSAGRFVMIGYQWSFSAAIAALKRDIATGAFGRPLRVKTICLWPRDHAYYRRNNWAGKQKDAAGRWVLDSPANNAMAHFLHNLFYLLGDGPADSARPIEVTAELYRAYPIENYDTAVCRAYTAGGVEVLFYGSHVIPNDRGPMFHLEFEDTVVSFGEFADEIIATDKRGRRKSYGSPEDSDQFLKLLKAVEAARESHLQLRMAVPCGPEAALPQLLCVNGMQESVPEITTLPESMIEAEDEDSERLWVPGLTEALFESYAKAALPSELGYFWARRGATVNLENYRFFPGGRRSVDGRIDGTIHGTIDGKIDGKIDGRRCDRS